MKPSSPPLRSHAERDALVTANLRLVYKIAGKLFRTDPAVRRLGLDEAISAGTLALVKAAGLFREELGWQFSTYACRSIAVEVIRASRHQGLIHVPEGVFGDRYSRCDDERRAELQEFARQAQRVSFVGCMATEESYGNTPEALVFRCEDDTERRDEADERRRQVKRLLNAPGLNRKDVELLRMYFMRRWTLETIGRQVGLSRERVRQRIGRAVRVIRRHCGVSGDEVKLGGE